jgi:tetratricopeptide (TPR) repeat protein
MTRMQLSWRFIVLALLAVGVAPPFAPAVEPYLEFVRGLQEKGYPDVALDYLDLLDARKDLPPKIRDILDLERSNSLAAWARVTGDPKLAEHRLGQAQAFLNKFAKDHPQHPRAASATAFRAEVTLQRGQEILANARRVPDAARRATLLASARPAFAEAVKTLDAAVAVLRGAAEKLPAGGAGKAERTELELAAVEIRFKNALAHYYLAQTYPDAADPQRKAILEQSAKLFDGIYQDFRDSNYSGCLLAHLWQGHVLEEMGDYTTALDIYEEVLAGAPEQVTADGEAPLYAQAALFQFRALAASGKANRVVEEAPRWLKSHEAWAALSAYHGVILELAKAQLATAEATKGDVRAHWMRNAIALLTRVSQGQSEYKEEALHLQQRLAKDPSPQNSGVEQFFVLGDAALNNKQFAEAESNYNQALKLATESKNEKLVTECRQRLTRVRYVQALTLYNAGKLDEAITAAGAVAREDLNDPSSGRGAVLALTAASAQLAAAEGRRKEQELERLKSIVDFVIKRWAGRPEADDARIAMGQAQLMGGDQAAAMATFGQIDKTSKRYPAVLYVLAQMQWRAYLAERKKDEASRSVEQMNTARAEAEKFLRQAADLLKRGGAGDSFTSAAQLAETQLLLAEVLIEGRQYPQAIELLDPLVSKVSALRPETIDNATFRTFMGAVRAHLATGDTTRAGATVMSLIEVAQDNAQFNEVLVTFARLMARELDRAETAKTAAVSGDAKTFAEANAKAAGLKQLLRKMLDALLKRQQLSLADMVHLGDLCSVAGSNEQALAQYQRILDRVQQDPEAAQKAGRAIIRVRAQLVGLLRTQGKFEEAAKQCDELIAKNPRALEPRMVKGFILEDWAKQNPEKFVDAVAQWTEVRMMLGRMAQKPPEYYDVIYHTASCLFELYQKTKDAARLQQAEQVLKSTLVLSPNLNGQERVEQYRELLKRIATAREAGGK